MALGLRRATMVHHHERAVLHDDDPPVETAESSFSAADHLISPLRGREDGARL